MGKIVNKNPFDKFGITPLHMAAQKGHLQVCKMIMEFLEVIKNPIDILGETPLHLAAKNGHFETCKLFIAHENVENPNPQDIFGLTPLHLASDRGHLDICRFILECILEIEENCQISMICSFL